MFGLIRLWTALGRLTDNLERLANLSGAVVGEVENRLGVQPVTVPQLQAPEMPSESPGNGQESGVAHASPGPSEGHAARVDRDWSRREAGPREGLGAQKVNYSKGQTMTDETPTAVLPASIGVAVAPLQNYTLPEAARILRISLRTLYRLIGGGKLLVARVGGRRLVRAREIERLLDRGTTVRR